jgi:hypothetical protein
MKTTKNAPEAVVTVRVTQNGKVTINSNVDDRAKIFRILQHGASALVEGIISGAEKSSPIVSLDDVGVKAIRRVE